MTLDIDFGQRMRSYTGMIATGAVIGIPMNE
jgi:hypothetical protein